MRRARLAGSLSSRRWWSERPFAARLDPGRGARRARPQIILRARAGGRLQRRGRRARAAQRLYHARRPSGRWRWPMPRISGLRGARRCRSTASRSRSRTSSAPRGVLTTAASHILDGFHPPYKSTVTDKLWQSGAVMLGKANLDEFAMGSSNTTSWYGPVENPWRRSERQATTAHWFPAARRAARRPPWPRGRRSPRPAPIPAARSASRRAFAASSGSNPPMAAARAGGSLPSPPRSTIPGR